MSTIPKLHMVTNKKHIFSMFVYVPSGSIYESPNQKGISHFLEHMMFRNKGESSNISKTLTSIGGKYNATTYKDTTCFFIVTTDEHYKEVIDMLHQITCMHNFSPSELQVERKVVLEELGQSGGLQSNVADLTYKSVLAASNKYTNSVIGTKHSLSSITMSDLKNYIKARYKNMMIMINCDYRTKQNVEKYVCKKFKICVGDKFKIDEPWLVKGSQAIEPKLIFINSSSPQYVTAMTFATFPGNLAKENVVLKFIQYCLTSSGLHSILNEAIRVKKGLVYTVSSYVDPMRYIGLFYIQFQSTNKRTDVIINLVLDMLNSLKTRGLTPKSFEYFMKSYKSTLKVKLSDEASRTEYHGLNTFYGATSDDNTMMHLVDTITNEDIRRVSQMAFDFHRLGILSIGYYDDLDNMNYQVEKVIMAYEDS